MNLVSAQQSTLQSQQQEITQCDVETNFLEGQIGLPSQPNVRGFAPQPQPQMQPQPGSQLEMVLAEARRLEEIAHGNEDELRLLAMEQRGPTPANLTENFESEDPNIRAEILQLKQRLAGTDTELQKTSHGCRRVGDEMRSMSLEKTRQREVELAQEIERLQMEIKNLQKNSEEA